MVRRNDLKYCVVPYTRIAERSVGTERVAPSRNLATRRQDDRRKAPAEGYGICQPNTVETTAAAPVENGKIPISNGLSRQAERTKRSNEQET